MKYSSTSQSSVSSTDERGTSAGWKLLRKAHTHTIWLLNRARESGIVLLHNYIENFDSSDCSLNVYP